MLNSKTETGFLIMCLFALLGSECTSDSRLGICEDLANLQYCKSDNALNDLHRKLKKEKRDQCHLHLDYLELPDGSTSKITGGNPCFEQGSNKMIDQAKIKTVLQCVEKGEVCTTTGKDNFQSDLFRKCRQEANLNSSTTLCLDQLTKIFDEPYGKPPSRYECGKGSLQKNSGQIHYYLTVDMKSCLIGEEIAACFTCKGISGHYFKNNGIEVENSIQCACKKGPTIDSLATKSEFNLSLETEERECKFWNGIFNRRAEACWSSR